MLSVVIPSYKDPLLNKTIQSLLDNAEGDIEVIPVLDGYKQHVLEDPRVHPIYLGENQGQKHAASVGLKMARGEFVARSDEHCLFSPSFDRVTEIIKPNWVVTPRRYFLNPDTWEVMDKTPVDYEKLVIKENPRKFSGQWWPSRQKERADIEIDETMMMQGSFWVCRKEWFDSVIGEFDTKYGDHYQDQAELVFKTWQNGGKLMVDKRYWFAHKHRDFARTHHYSHSKAQPGWDAVLKDYRDYYEHTIRPRFNI